MNSKNKSDSINGENHTPFISFVIPVYNEFESLPELYRRLKLLVDNIDKSYEIIFVDDGSSDNSVEVIKGLYNKDNNIKLVRLSRNHGHQIAITAGLNHATGTITVSMDADLQHPPEIVPKLIAEWEKGYDIVNAVKVEDKSRGRLKKFLANSFYYIFNKIADIDINPHGSDFRLYSKAPLQVLKDMPEQQRFLRGLIKWIGFEHKNVEYEVSARFAGEAKYSIFKLVKLAKFGVLSFSVAPLRASFYIGMITAFFAFAYAIYAIYKRFFIGGVPIGFTDMIASILFLGGIQLMFLGIIGEYLAKVYQEVRRRPLYIVKERMGFNAEITKGQDEVFKNDVNNLAEPLTNLNNHH